MTSLAQLASLVTSIDEAKTEVTYNFGPDASITLVGITPAEISEAVIEVLA